MFGRRTLAKSQRVGKSVGNYQKALGKVMISVFQLRAARRSPSSRVSEHPSRSRPKIAVSLQSLQALPLLQLRDRYHKAYYRGAVTHT